MRARLLSAPEECRRKVHPAPIQRFAKDLLFGRLTNVVLQILHSITNVLICRMLNIAK